jgi:hypothetical protein
MLKIAAPGLLGEARSAVDAAARQWSVASMPAGRSFAAMGR